MQALPWPDAFAILKPAFSLFDLLTMPFYCTHAWLFLARSLSSAIPPPFFASPQTVERINFRGSALDCSHLISEFAVADACTIDCVWHLRANVAFQEDVDCAAPIS